jgi:hypothetical protein
VRRFIDCANFDGILSHITNKLMLSLYLRKDKSENSSVEILRRTTGMYILDYQC